MKIRLILQKICQPIVRAACAWQCQLMQEPSHVNDDALKNVKCIGPSAIHAWLGLTRHALVGLTRPSIFSVAAALWLCLRPSTIYRLVEGISIFQTSCLSLRRKKKLFASSFLLQSFVHCDLIASNPRVSKTFETGIWCKLTFMDPVRWMVKDCAARCRHHRRAAAAA